MPKFTITDKAGKEVAGMPNPGAGETIELTTLQAEHPMRIGHIEPYQEPKKDEPAKAKG